MAQAMLQQKKEEERHDAAQALATNMLARLHEQLGGENAQKFMEGALKARTDGQRRALAADFAPKDAALCESLEMLAALVAPKSELANIKPRKIA